MLIFHDNYSTCPYVIVKIIHMLLSWIIAIPEATKARREGTAAITKRSWEFLEKQTKLGEKWSFKQAESNHVVLLVVLCSVAPRKYGLDVLYFLAFTLCFFSLFLLHVVRIMNCLICNPSLQQSMWLIYFFKKKL